METPGNPLKYQLFSALGLFILGLDLLAIILAIFGFFYLHFIIAYSIIGGFFILSMIYQNHKMLKIDWPPIFLGVIALSATIFFSFSASPSVFSGRDQGSFAEAAIRLSQNHELAFESSASQEFFKIHGTGLAQNFPGFNYDSSGKLVPHFSLGYIAWLAVFHSLFGLGGFAIANSLTFLLFLVSFLIIIRIYSNKFALTLISLLFILTSFIFSWLPKFTLSENLALGFLWFALAQLAIFIKNNNRQNLYLSFFSLIILAFSRLETWSFIIMLIFFLCFKFRREKAALVKIFNKKFFLIAAIMLIIYLVNIYANSPFYISSLKGLLKSFSSSDDGLGSIVGITYVFRVLSVYALIAPLLLGVVGVFYFIRNKRFEPLIPLVIILPSFIYLVHPGISLDHPWMLRRFIFSIVPASFLISTIFLHAFFKKKLYFYGLFAMMILTNLIILLPYADYAENKDLLADTKKLSENFSSTDLVLVDRLTSGNGWAMVSGPLNFLFGKQAAYFFDPKDLDKIDMGRFTNIYFIIPDDNLDFYARHNIINRLVPINDYALRTSSLETSQSSSMVSLPQKDDRVIFGKIYLLKD